MKHAAVLFCWLVVTSLAVWLRFEDPAARPFHFDEATGAKIMAERMEGTGGRFNPKHHHGPLLGDLGMVACWLRGEHGWRELTKETLRIVPALAGTLLVLAPLCWRRRLGNPAALLAAAFLATSPLLVYYSRMFIHEILLALFGILALAALTNGLRWVAAGVMIGLMYATKETFAISIIAWTCAAVPVVCTTPGWCNRETITRLIRDWWKPCLAGGLTSIATAGLLYTDFLRHPAGAIDAVMTFFVYDTVDGHDKPFGWYFNLLARPEWIAGRWWFETPVVILALAAFGGSFVAGTRVWRHRQVIRFIGYAAVAHFVIYGLIAYKTPWLVCLPWAHVCLLAGCAVAAVPADRRVWRAVAVAVMVACLVPQVRLARFAAGRFASDERNRYAYVPTRPDLERLEGWLLQLRAAAPAGTVDAIGVVGWDYWPLPWYLRSFDQAGYWRSPPAGLAELPIVLALPETAEATAGALATTHVAVPRGLRAEVPLIVHVRQDLWNQWMNQER